jgi:hypothetical protein
MPGMIARYRHLGGVVARVVRAIHGAKARRVKGSGRKRVKVVRKKVRMNMYASSRLIGSILGRRF